LALARAGADVAITYRNSHTDASQTLEQIRSLNCRALAVECDVRSEDSVRSVIHAVTAIFGRLDLLVNNAAVFESSPLEQISLEAWTKSSRPMHADRSWLREKRCPICAPLKDGS